MNDGVINCKSPSHCPWRHWAALEVPACELGLGICPAELLLGEKLGLPGQNILGLTSSCTQMSISNISELLFSSSVGRDNDPTLQHCA